LKDVIEAPKIWYAFKGQYRVGVLFTEWVKQIGADGYSEDAIGAAKVARQLLGI
jgi:hypothetical protein